MISGPFSGFPARSAFHINKQKQQLSQSKKNNPMNQKHTPRNRSKEKQKQSIQKVTAQPEITREKWIQSDIIILKGLRNCKQDFELYLGKLEKEERAAKRVYGKRWGVWNAELGSEISMEK